MLVGLEGNVKFRRACRFEFVCCEQRTRSPCSNVYSLVIRDSSGAAVRSGLLSGECRMRVSSKDAPFGLTLVAMCRSTLSR